LRLEWKKEAQEGPAFQNKNSTINTKEEKMGNDGCELN